MRAFTTQKGEGFFKRRANSIAKLSKNWFGSSVIEIDSSSSTISTIGSSSSTITTNNCTESIELKLLHKALGSKKMKVLRSVPLGFGAALHVEDFSKITFRIFKCKRTITEWINTGRGMQQTIKKAPPYFLLSNELMSWHPYWANHLRTCHLCRN